jgi:hypothetical protein
MATKKVASKKGGAKAPAKKSAAKKPAAKGWLSKGTQDDPMVRALVVIFAAFSVLFAIMAALRYGDW